MKNRLSWYVNRRDVFDRIRGYAADFEAKITDDIHFYIGYYVFMNNADEWCLGIIQTAPNNNAAPITIKCYDPEVGKKMAEDELQKIFNGMQALLDTRGR